MGHPLTSCAMCDGKLFDSLGEIQSGLWLENSDRELTRQSNIVALGSCVNCGHVQVITPLELNDIIALYRNSWQENVRINWENRDSPIDFVWSESVFSFCQPEILNRNNLIADIGCGSGGAIAVLSKYYKIHHKNIIAIDFKNIKIPEKFHFIEADINNISMEDENLESIVDRVNFAFCESILEHVISPRAFLRFVRRHLSPGGFAYIGVPDCDGLGSPMRVGDTPLINPQHLHYFSVRALTALAASSGFEVVRINRSLNLGYPHIEILLRRAEPAPTAGVVTTIQSIINGNHQLVADHIVTLAAQPSGVRLWGVGGDLLSILDLQPALNAVIADGEKIRLYDLNFHGKTLLGASIAAPEILTDPADHSPIVITPRHQMTRGAMLRFAEQAGFIGKVLDFYQ